MWEHCMHQIFLCGFQLATNDIALDHFRHLCADHMRSQKFACFRIKDRFNQTFCLAKGDGFAVAATQLNEELAQKWPNITEMKEQMPEAAKWDGVEGKIQYLEK